MNSIFVSNLPTSKQRETTHTTPDIYQEEITRPSFLAMSAEEDKGGPAVQPVRMDQEFQLQNLRRLAMNQDFESMGQYANEYLSLANNGHKDVSLTRYLKSRVPLAVAC